MGKLNRNYVLEVKLKYGVGNGDWICDFDFGKVVFYYWVIFVFFI